MFQSDQGGTVFFVFLLAILFTFPWPPLNLYVPEVPAIFAVYLFHANLIAAMQIQKNMTGKKKRFSMIGLKTI